MQVTGQNNNITQQLPPCCCQPITQSVQAQATSQVQTQPKAADCCPVTQPAHYPAGYVSPQNMYPQYQTSAQTMQIPSSASGVNIQIFNPSVGTPGAAPTYNVNAPCYPSGYYTNSIGPDGKLYPNNSGVGQHGDNTNNGTIGGNVNTGTNNGTIGNDNGVNNSGANGTGANGTGGTGANGNNSGVGQTGNNTNNGTIDGNVNSGTNNGTIGNGNNSNNVTNNNTTIDNSNSGNDKKKTEKRKIVELTDDYIRNLETYLNSQDKQVRLNAAKEVYARLEEDDSRYDDKALNALVNKMLQDPSRDIRFLALAALEGRICKGDDYTVGVLQKMQANNNDPLNQEAADASNILLKMSGRQVEKEFEVKEKSDKKPNEMSETFKPEGTKI